MKNNDFLRARNMVIQDKTDFHQERFCRDLKNFLSDYFSFDCLTVETVDGENQKLIICVTVSNVKKTYTL